MTIQEKQEKIVAEFNQFQDWTDKYEYLIEEGKSLPLIDEAYKTENNIIKGCQSQVWLHASFDGERVFFTADSDAIITKGIIALLIRVYSGHTPDEILNNELFFIDQIGLREHLSPTRANGLLAMIKQMKLYALAFKTKQTNQNNPK